MDQKVVAVMSNEEDFSNTPENHIAMRVHEMRTAIKYLKDMAGTTYGLPYVMRDVSDLESLMDDLEQLILLLEHSKLRKVS